MNDKVIKEHIQAMSTIELVTKLTELERQIEMAILLCDEYYCELNRRYPTANLEDTDLNIKRKVK